MKEKDIDKLFRDALQSGEATPSPKLWDQIARQLDEEAEKDEEIIHLAPAVKKRNYLWVRYAAACALVGVGLLAYFMTQQQDAISPKTEIAHQQMVKKRVDSIKEDIASDDKVIENMVHPERLLTHSTAPVQQEESVGKTPSESIEQKRMALINQPEVNQIVVMEKPETPTLQQIQLAAVPTIEFPTRFVTDVEPIKPLIEPFEEEEEMMIAGTVRKATSNVINKIIDVVSDNTPTQVTKDVYVLKDDEGSFRLEIGNLFAKNRTKKRK